MISLLPFEWQARIWCWQADIKINAIRKLRKSASLPLKDAKYYIDKYWRI